ncbi:MAG: caspase family protein [Deltaproteobacteria bacterium]|nr:MAG: caspase family protein [Deltaproteobacteria bacterium]
MRRWWESTPVRRPATGRSGKGGLFHFFWPGVPNSVSRGVYKVTDRARDRVVPRRRPMRSQPLPCLPLLITLALASRDGRAQDRSEADAETGDAATGDAATGDAETGDAETGDGEAPEVAPAPTASFALVVGSNRPGPGQVPLRWALADADRVERVFTELGGVPPDHVTLLADPSVDELLDALDSLGERLAAWEGRDERTTVLFYYSGHARASGLDLGGALLSLDELRDRLASLPATVRLVVLDACQAGAMSEVKGVTPAAAFSTASIAGLDLEGMAVIASSTGSELSQESDELQGSYFTHHFVAGLRGAADQDLDGTVTLDEAYRYAYDRTLVSTSTTAVGRQHATLETDLRGRGGLVLTRPAVASARGSFGVDIQGEILLVDPGSGNVVAEVSKVAADRVVMALAPAEYDVLWRQGAVTLACSWSLPEGQTTEFSPTDCDEVVIAPTAGKGAPVADSRLEIWALELAVGGTSINADAYTERLQDFSFEDQTWLSPTAMMTVGWAPHRLLSVVGSVAALEQQAWRRAVEDPDGAAHSTGFSWRGTRLTLALRGQLPLLDGWVVPYVQAGAGPATVRSEFDDGPNGVTVERHWGAHVAAGGGLQLMPRWNARGWRHLGIYLQGELVHAPVMDNLLGETHQSGGQVVTAGLRFTM